MKNEIIQTVLSKMKDTDDPKVGSVFEKSVETDFATFCAFILTQYDNVSMVKHEEKNDGAKITIYLFYSDTDGTKNATNHCASYFIYSWEKSYGCFGGTRVGSKNTAWNDTGKDLVNNPFVARSAA